MIYKNEKRLSENKKFAFSLIEVLMALLIVSVLLVLMAPVITKKVTDKQSDGVVFTFDPNNQAISDLGCYFATTNNYDSVTELYNPDETGCSEYSFVVPEGVNKINLTLVGGGGGGGGASGIEEKKVPSTIPTIIKSSGTNTETQSISLTDLKKATIDFLGVKGNDGKDADLQPYNGNLTCCGYASASCSCNSGSGGTSSPAIVNFDIPNEILRNNYEEKLERDPILTSEEKHNITIDTSDNLSSVKIENGKPFGKNFGYQISGSDAYFSCGFSSTNGGTVNFDNDDLKANGSSFSACKLNENNMIRPQEGQETQKWSATDSFRYPLTAHGGNGGQIPGFEKYGYGGKGASVTFRDIDDPNKIGVQSPNNLVADIYGKQEGGPAHAQITLHYEHYSASGGGGAPGGAVRLLSLPVNSGEEYIVRVGKGGAGGNAGNQKANGINGGSGYSTAFLRKNNDDTETLMFVVNGGIGGQGGQAVEDGNDTKGKSAQHYSRFYSPTEFKNLVTVDEKLSIIEKNKGSYSSLIFDKVLEYPAFTKNKVIGKLVYNITPGDILQTKNQNLLKQVSGSHLSTGENNGRSTINLNGTSYPGVYTGLYYKTVIDNATAIVGENGGFNGLSMKAGCGGLFMGNFDGRQHTASGLDHHAAFVNKFVVSDELYNISDYYDNCTMDSLDGQSANFVMPNPINKTYGQAGAGGGGGGYSLTRGVGKGGNGQNGYLMIDWKK